MSSIIKGLQNEQNDFQVNVPGYGTVPLEMLKRHVKELSKDFNDMIQSEEFIKAAYKTEQFYNALFALSKAMKAKSVEEGYSAGAVGGAGLGIEKSPMEKVLEKPLGETEQLDELSPETLARYKKAAGADASKADKEGDFERGNKRFSGIVRATKKEFNKAVSEEQAEEKKPRTAKALIYQTDVYGAKGYYAQCKESGCDHKTKSYDRAVQAQNAIKKHHQEHFKEELPKESSIMKGLQTEEKVDEYGEVVPGQRKIVFSKENKPDLYYLYQQFIQRMLNPENEVDPYEWIDKVNKHYDLNYSWKDYQKRGHNDQTDNWQKIVNKYIVNKK